MSDTSRHITSTFPTPPAASLLEESPDLVEQMYAKLRSIAEGILKRERSGHTLQPTALVHEVYLKLSRSEHPLDENGSRQHFLRLAARAMRQILVNHERDRVRIKRGGGMRRVPVDELQDLVLDTDGPSIDLLALDDALAGLEKLDPRKVEIVQLRFFGGLTNSETAAVIGLSLAQVKRDWALARAWLARELEDS